MRGTDSNGGGGRLKPVGPAVSHSHLILVYRLHQLAPRVEVGSSPKTGAPALQQTPGHLRHGRCPPPSPPAPTPAGPGSRAPSSPGLAPTLTEPGGTAAATTATRRGAAQAHLPPQPNFAAPERPPRRGPAPEAPPRVRLRPPRSTERPPVLLRHSSWAGEAWPPLSFRSEGKTAAQEKRLGRNNQERAEEWSVPRGLQLRSSLRP